MPDNIEKPIQPDGSSLGDAAELPKDGPLGMSTISLPVIRTDSYSPEFARRQPNIVSIQPDKSSLGDVAELPKDGLLGMSTTSLPVILTDSYSPEFARRQPNIASGTAEEYRVDIDYKPKVVPQAPDNIEFDTLRLREHQQQQQQGGYPAAGNLPHLVNYDEIQRREAATKAARVPVTPTPLSPPPPPQVPRTAPPAPPTALPSSEPPARVMPRAEDDEMSRRRAAAAGMMNQRQQQYRPSTIQRQPQAPRHPRPAAGRRPYMPRRGHAARRRRMEDEDDDYDYYDDYYSERYEDDDDYYDD